MLSLIDSLEAIEFASLGNDRLAAVKKVDSPELRELLNYAMSPDMTFGMKQLPEPIPAQVAVMEPDDWWPVLKDILNELAARQLTGTAAKKRVGSFLGLCAPLEQKWAERILLQDLRLSIGSKDVNKAIGTMVVRVFSIPLAKPFKDLKSLKGMWRLQLKMDGARVITEIDCHGNLKLLSRTGKEWGSSFDPIREGVRKVIDELGLRDTVLDGEVVIWRNGRMDFQEMQKMFFPKDGRKPNGDMRYTLFDMADVDEYYEPSLFYGMRLEKLMNTVGQIALPSVIEIIKSERLVSPEQEYLDKKAVEYVEKYGCDGAIIRRADKAPTNRKSSDITKVKPFEDGEAFIRGKVEGKGHLVGSLGTMVCELIKDKKPTGVMFEIGTGEGLTKDLRQEMWDDADLDKKIVNFKYQRLTDDGVPLLPTFRGLRHPDDF